MKLSLCIATYNEEKFIHYPLDSAYNLADEVIIIDGSSIDKTVEKAKSYGDKVKVYVEDNPPMFHINKQKALTHVKGDWVLQLDADEALSKELKQEIIELLSSSEKQAFDAYKIPRKNFFLTRFLKKGGQYPDYTIRLYKAGKAHFPCKSVHENVEINGKIGSLKKPLLHYADLDFSRYIARWNRYTTLDADILIKENKKTCFLSYFVFKPISWFLKTYIRHKGFVDGFPGFVFALFSSIKFWAIYVKVYKKRKEAQA